jgi:hypothetical protein
MRRFVVNRETAAKLGAGLLVAIALAFSLPALMKSEQPEPLPPDVGLPQAPAPPPAPPPPDPLAAQKAAKRAAAARRRAAREKARRQAARKRKRRKQREEPAAAPAPAASGSYAVSPAGTREDFGFERP